MKQRIKRVIYRKCLVCGKKIRVIVYKDKFYTGAHYFRKMKIPIGPGEYKKVKTTKLFGKKINVVKWVGKEKNIEYWECNKCYEEALHEDWLEEIIEKLYGKKCPDYEAGCVCCQVWDVYETIIDSNRGRI